METTVLIYAEDPGAANFISPLPESLASSGVTSVVLAGGLAARYFERQNRTFVECFDNDRPSELLAKFSPKLLVVGTSENRKSLGLRLVDEARIHGIHTVGIVDRESNAAARFQGTDIAPLAHAPNTLFVPDLGVLKAFEELGFPRQDICISGDPNHDRVRLVARELELAGFETVRKEAFRCPVSRPLLLFLAEPPSRMNPLLTTRSKEYTLAGRGVSDDRCHIVLEELLSAVCECNPRPFFAIRLHPKNEINEFAPYFDEIDSIIADGDPLESVYAADLVVGMTTTLLQEARLMNSRTLSVLPRECEAAWLPSIAHGLIPYVTSREAIRNTLSDWLSGNWFEPKHSVDSEGCFPSGAINRVTNEIVRLVERVQ